VAEADTTSHATHDPLLVAALVDRDLSGPEHDLAKALVADCSACAKLHADLRSLAGATRALPTPPRPRDFTLSPADAERLRPNLVRRLLGAIGSSRDTFSRPLAMGLTTLGLAGLLVATVPTVLPSGGAAADTELSAPGDAGGPEQPAASSDVSGDDGGTYLQQEARSETGSADSREPAPGLVGLSLAFVLAGLGLGGLRLAVRRGRGNHGSPGVV
jgi:anti-sigma factor RsiW